MFRNIIFTCFIVVVVSIILTFSTALKDVLSVLADFGTFFASLVVLFTLAEIYHQRKLASQPDLLVTNSSFISLDPMIWQKIIPDTKEEKGACNNVLQFESFYKVPFYNIGNDIAKDICLEWSYDKELFLNKITALMKELNTGEQIEVTADNSFLSYIGIKSPDHFINIKSCLNDKFPFFLPSSIDKTPMYCTVPPAYIFLVSKYLQLNFKKNPMLNLRKKFPNIYLKITFSNKEGDMFIRKFKFIVDLIMYSTNNYKAHFTPVLVK